MRVRIAALCATALVVGCAIEVVTPPITPRFRAEAWPEADRLFRGDRNWVGGDGAYSIDLGAERVLWLFADTFIDPTGAGSRRSPGTTMIGNSIAIQHGADPTAATIDFHWWRTVDGAPAPFFAGVGDDRYWPGHGVRLGDSLLVFLMRVKTVKEGLGFAVTDWDAVLVSNIDDEPGSWDVKVLDTPSDGSGIIVGTGAVIAEGDYVYAYASTEPGGRELFLARFPREAAGHGDLSGQEWWSGDRGYVRASSGNAPTPVFRNGATEFTVHRDAPSGRWLLFECAGFGATDISMRDAKSPDGPWSFSDVVYRPPEKNRDRVLLYQGKAHPELTGADLVLTYCSNHLDFSTLVADDALYFPRFVRLTRFSR